MQSLSEYLCHLWRAFFEEAFYIAPQGRRGQTRHHNAGGESQHGFVAIQVSALLFYWSINRRYNPFEVGAFEVKQVEAHPIWHHL